MQDILLKSLKQTFRKQVSKKKKEKKRKEGRKKKKSKKLLYLQSFEFFMKSIFETFLCVLYISNAISFLILKQTF